VYRCCATIPICPIRICPSAGCTA